MSPAGGDTRPGFSLWRRGRGRGWGSGGWGGGRPVGVARSLPLLELFRERALTFEQLTPLGELRVRWVAGDSDEIQISAEFDTEPEGQERRDD